MNTMPLYGSKKEDAGWIRFAPAGLLLFFVLLSATPLPFGEGRMPMPSLALVTVFFWSLLHPSALPAWLLFIAGIALDVLLGLPTGLHALLFLLLRVLLAVISGRFAKQSIWVFWLGFAATSAGFWVTYRVLLEGFHHASLPLDALFWPWALTTLSYPLLHLLFVRVLGRMT